MNVVEVWIGGATSGVVFRWSSAWRARVEAWCGGGGAGGDG